jgi:hypothetical protein
MGTLNYYMSEDRLNTVNDLYIQAKVKAQEACAIRSFTIVPNAAVWKASVFVSVCQCPSNGGACR